MLSHWSKQVIRCLLLITDQLLDFIIRFLWKMLNEQFGLLDIMPGGSEFALTALAQQAVLRVGIW